MAADLFTLPSRAFDANGNILPGAKLYLYATGTTTPQAGFTTSALSTPLANPVVADAGGNFPAIYFNTGLTYRAVLKSADDSTTVFDIDPVNTSPLNTLASASGAGLIGFINTGTGATVRTVQSKLREIVTPEDFGAVGDGVTDDTAAILAALAAAKSVTFTPGKTYKTTSTLTVPPTCYRIEGNGAYMTGPGYNSSVDGFYFTGFNQGPSTYPTWHQSFRSQRYRLPGMTGYRAGISIYNAGFLNIECDIVKFCTSAIRIQAGSVLTNWSVQNIIRLNLAMQCTNALELICPGGGPSVEGIQGCYVHIDYSAGCNNGILGTFVDATANINYNIFRFGNLDGNGANNNPAATYANAVNFNLELSANINSFIFDNEPINMVPSTGNSPYINVGVQEVVQSGRYMGNSFRPYNYGNFLPGGWRTTARPGSNTMYVYVDQSVGTSGVGSQASPYKTIAEAVAAILEMDGFGNTAVIQLAAGTYSEAVSLDMVSKGNGNWNIQLSGVLNTPGSVTLTGGVTFTGRPVTLQDVTITTSGLVARKQAYVALNRVNFGAVTGVQVTSETGATVEIGANYTISGGASVHAQTNFGGRFICLSRTVTITGTPAFSSYFAYAAGSSYQDFTGCTFSGTATGTRAGVATLSCVNTNGGGTTFLPGNAAPVVVTGGVYA